MENLVEPASFVSIFLRLQKRFRTSWLKQLRQRLVSAWPAAKTSTASADLLGDHQQFHQTRAQQQKEATLQQISLFLATNKQPLFAIWQAHAEIHNIQSSSDYHLKLTYKDLLGVVEQHLTNTYFPGQGITAADLDSQCVELAREFAAYAEKRSEDHPAHSLLAPDHRVLTADRLAGYPGRPETGHRVVGDDCLYQSLLLHVARLEEVCACGLLITPEVAHIHHGLHNALLALRRSSLFDGYLTSRTPERQAVYSYCRRWPFLTLFLGGAGSLPVLVEKLLACAADFATSAAYRTELVAYFRGQGGTRYGPNSYDYLLLADLLQQVVEHVTDRLEKAPLAPTA